MTIMKMVIFIAQRQAGLCSRAVYMHGDMKRAPYGWVCMFSLTCGRALGHISAAACVISTRSTIDHGEIPMSVTKGCKGDV